MDRLSAAGVLFGLALAGPPDALAQAAGRGPGLPDTVAPAAWPPSPVVDPPVKRPVAPPASPRGPAPVAPADRPLVPVVPPFPSAGEPWRPPQVGVPASPQVPRPAAMPLLAAPPGSPTASAGTAEHEPGQLLVLWSDAEEARRGLALLQQRYRLAPLQRHVLEQLGGVLAVLQLPGDSEARALRDRLRLEQQGWVVDLNARARPQQSGGPRLYAHHMLGVAPTRRGSAPPALRVGVVDTAVSPSLLQPAALNGSVAYLRSVLDPGDRPADAAHGDALLQLIAGADGSGSFAGAAPPLELFWAGAMRDVAGRPSTNTLLLAQALDWLVGQRVVLVNLSLGGPGDAILHWVIARVLAAKVTVVAAAGNNPAPAAPPSFPAAYPGVWAATAVDADGRLYAGATRARYAMLAAPGVELWVPLGEAGLYVSGTSYAAALATATLAWHPAPFWRLEPAQRAAQVCANARKLEGVSWLACGLVQKAAAAP